MYVKTKYASKNSEVLQSGPRFAITLKMNKIDFPKLTTHFVKKWLSQSLLTLWCCFFDNVQPVMLQHALYYDLQAAKNNYGMIASFSWDHCKKLRKIDRKLCSDTYLPSSTCHSGQQLIATVALAACLWGMNCMSVASSQNKIAPYDLS